STQSTSYVTSTTLAEVQAMYASVKEYKGFYIARYEAGIDAQRTAQGNAADLPGIKEGTTIYSVMGKIPYTYIKWSWNSEGANGAVEVSRKMYPKTNTNYGVVSTLTYGVQWDRTLAWWLEVDAKDGNGNVIRSVTNSTSYGNYSNHVINSQEDLNEGAKYAVYDNSSGSYKLNSYQAATEASTKASGTWWALSTGALKVANVNNICDMAGNMWEWTMEGLSSTDRVLRGGYFHEYGFSIAVTGRGMNSPYSVNYCYGFRPSLYIKK
ncbi:MAG: hypothetical protein IJ272_07030, partial [Clostridia bacterium]|nr:hypothetical protein [Clostridia bacterium]